MTDVQARQASRVAREHKADDGEVPLVVDLEGALVRSDLLIESLLSVVRQGPFQLFTVLSWLARGHGYFTHRLAREMAPDIATLPYDYELILYLKDQRKRGRTIILVSEARENVARQVANHFGFFARVVVIDGGTKRDRLVAEFSLRGFDYVGHRANDRAVWAAARRAVLARPSNGLRQKIEKTTKVVRVLNDGRAGIRSYVAALRPHQWLKNALVFVPLAAADQTYGWSVLLHAAFAFVAFSLCASSGYLLNDLLDIARDRHHPHKKERPLASGRMSAAHAIALVPLLFVAGIGAGLFLPSAFLVALGTYYALTVAYSFGIKEVAVLDVLALAVLYTLRVAGGAWAVGVPQSSWLLAFCIFLFFSLALVKRYAELAVMNHVDGRRAHARAYVLEDRELLAALGGASGYLAVLVFGLWITIETPFPDPYRILWLDCLLLFYWITRMWLIAHRGRMDDDPLVFALRDRVSFVLILAMTAIFMGARLS